MNKINKPAGFWSKVASRIIDLLIICGVAVAFLFLFVTKKNDHYFFKEWWMFYLWYFLLIILLLIFFILTPILTKGFTVGNWVMRTKIISLENNLKKGIIKKEIFFSISWILEIVIIMSVINHSFINEFINKLSKKQSFYGWDSFRVAIVSTVSGVFVIIQLICIASLIVKKDNWGIHEKYGNVKIILVNKFIYVKNKENVLVKVKLKMVKNKPVEWIGD